jgi:hypothetical protein
VNLNQYEGRGTVSTHEVDGEIDPGEIGLLRGAQMDESKQRLAMLAELQRALDLAERLNEPALLYLIERALDEARSRTFSSVPADPMVRTN